MSSRLVQLTLATGISTLGSQVTAIALPWVILQGTDAAGLIGVASAISIAATVLLGVPAGTVVARLGPWRALILHEVVGLVAIGLFVVGLVVDAPLVPVVLAVSFMMGAIRPILITGATLAAADIDDRPTHLTTINGIVASAQQVGLISGQALGGLLIATWGAQWALALDVASFVIGGVLFSLCALSAGVSTGTAVSRGASWRAIRRLLDDVVLRRYIVIGATLSATMQMFLIYLPAVIAQLRLGVQWYGWAVAACGLGAVAGGILVGLLTRRIPIPVVLAMGVAFCIVPLTVPVLTEFSASTLVVAMTVVGFGAALVNAPLRAVLVVRIPPPDRARATAAALTAVTAATPFGAIVAGVALTAASPSIAWTWSVGAIILFASSMIVLLIGVRRRGREDTGDSTPSDDTAPGAHSR